MRQETPPPMPAPFTARLDESTLKALDRLTEKTNRSRNWLVGRAVEDLVALNAWRLDKIEAGLVAANRGDFAHDEELARVRKKFAPKSSGCVGQLRRRAISKPSAITSSPTIPPRV
jgi:predicted transcriptional regulator